MSIKKIAIIPNEEKKSAITEISSIAELVNKNGIKVLIEDKYKTEDICAEFVDRQCLSDADMIIALGGDGTMLSVAREYIKADTPILGINYGNLGFLTELEKDNTDGLDKILKGDFITEEHITLDISCTDSEKITTAVNEVVINRGNFSRIIEFDLYIDDRKVTSYFADGLIISTPTGSTAYSLSAGGPVADPELEIIIVTPICPHDLHSRSIILPADKGVKIVARNDAFVTIDGHFDRYIDESASLVVKRGKKVKLVRTPNSSFYSRLRQKLYERR